MHSSRTKVAIVGEAFGEQEERTGLPFLGAAGQELTKILREAGTNRSEFFLTNVFNMRPPNNDLRTLCVGKAEAVESFMREKPRLVEQFPDFAWPSFYNYPTLAGAGAFLHPRYLSHLARLWAELKGNGSGLCIALGNTACWALLNRTGIGKLRGYLYKSTLLDGLNVLPTYHPASILRQWSNRPIVIADIQKALRAVQSAANGGVEEGRGSSRTIWVEPDESDLPLWWSTYVPDTSTRVSVDIETFAGTITCIGFGVPRCGISVPFWDRRKPDGNYWPDSVSESRVFRTVEGWLRSGNPKLFQNAQYDLQYIWKTWGIPVGGVIEDTMLMHHALQPELPKDLGFLGSAYTDEVAWKDMRKQAHLKAKAEKKDE